MSQREFQYTDADFARVRSMIYARAGISISTAKGEMVYSRLSRRLRSLGLSLFSDYLDLLEQDPLSEEWEQFTNALTTNLTSFYREAHHFPVLADLLKRSSGPLRIWCSAASTGEEPYTLAITACEAFNTLSPKVQIIASDIDTQVLEKAALGVYPTERISGLSDERKQRFFLKGQGAQAGLVRVKPELRKLIEFQRVNLLDHRWPLDGQFDAIFCRNVMIYFDKPTQAKILERFAPLLKPKGLLFLGHSENISFFKSRFRLQAKTVYALSTVDPGDAQPVGIAAQAGKSAQSGLGGQQEALA